MDVMNYAQFIWRLFWTFHPYIGVGITIGTAYGIGYLIVKIIKRKDKK